MTFFISFKLSRQAHELYTVLQQQLNALHPAGSQATAQAASWRALSTHLQQASEHLRQNTVTPVAEVAQAAAGASIILLVQCVNLERLQRQLGLREIERITQLFTQYVSGATQLYDARHIDNPGAGVCLSFAVGNDATDATLRAIYCASVLDTLVQQLPQQTGMGAALDCRFSIDWQDAPAEVPEVIANLQRGKLFEQLYGLARHSGQRRIAVSAAVMPHVSLDAQRVVLEKIPEKDGDVASGFTVQEIANNYRELLDQQVQQLLAVHTTA